MASRTEAAGLIAAGRVLVAGSFADKGSRLVGRDEPVEVVGPPARFVSRGGEKLDAALTTFAIDPTGRLCLDAGSSTGGFTDCLLQRGAARVVAVDVGRGQLHPRLRDDPRVDVRERTDIRSVIPGDLTDPPGLVVADLSFIGLDRVLGSLVELAAPGADLVLLVKPQFEAGRAEAGRGRGVIRDPAVWHRVLVTSMGAVAGAGAAMMGAMVSPLRGAAGNVEFFLHAVARTSPEPGPGAESALEETARRLVDSVGEQP